MERITEALIAVIMPLISIPGASLTMIQRIIELQKINPKVVKVKLEGRSKKRRLSQ